MVAENIIVWRRSGQQAKDPSQVGREAHVDHAIGLVEHQDLDVLEVHALPSVEIEQPSRGGHEQVHALVAQHPFLRSDRHAAEDDARPADR